MIVTIANPAAGRGKGVHILRALEATDARARATGILTTQASGDEARLVKQALRQGAKTNGVAGVKRGRMLMITVSNGRFLGGAFKIAPHASVLDGRLDACFFSDANVVQRVRLFAGALRGTHEGMPQVVSASVQQLTLIF